MEPTPATSLPVGAAMAIRTQVGRISLPGISRQQANRTGIKIRQAADPLLSGTDGRLEPLAHHEIVLDGEIVISIEEDLSFDSLLMRIHPPKTRVKRLSQDAPSLFIVFDLLVNPSGKSLVGSLLLGLYDRAGKLDHVGFTSSISAEARSGLTQNWRRW